MGNIPSRSPYQGQFITLCSNQSWPVSGLIQYKPVKKHKLSSTFCSFTPCFLLLSFVLSNEATVHQSLSFLQRHSCRLGVILIALLTLVYCARTHGFETVLVTLMSVSSAGWQLYHLAASLVTLQSVSSPSCQPSCLAAGCLTALQSVSSPYSQYRHLAVSLLPLLLVALKLASQPCSWSP